MNDFFNSNDQFSKLNADNLLELLMFIDDYYIDMRNNIGLNPNLTFGCEIEFEEANREIIKEMIINSDIKEWEVDFDESVCKREYGIEKGGEVVSDILFDSKEHWDNLSTVCDILKKNNALNNGLSGAHIHIGSHIYGRNYEAWKNLYKMWILYEKIIMRFSYNEDLKPRKNMNAYAHPVSKLFFKDRNLKQLEKKDNGYVIKFLRGFDRYNAINFQNVFISDLDFLDYMNTIEIRCPNGTIEPVIWQNNINFFTKFLLSAKNQDVDKLNYQLKLYKDNFISSELYTNVFLQDALELSDNIFNNNLDKINFLKQYLKQFDIPDSTDIKSKTKLLKR